MSLPLDSRQRAMLAEMSVRLFEPLPPVEAAAESRAEPPRQSVVAPALAAREQKAPPPVARQAAEEPAVARAGIELLEWDALEQAVASCRACALCAGRRNAVFGAGDRKADWLVVGDPPDETEDLQGEPFAGPEGKLLDNMLKALGLERQANVYLSNVLKCWPSGHRNAEPRELAQCEPFLRRQVALLQPKIILAMGRFAVQALLGSDEPMGKLRGRVHEYLGVPLVVTYHPAYLLRNLPDKGKAWADLCLALDVMRAQAAAAAEGGR